MSARPAAFKQADITRMPNGIRAAGLQPGAVMIDYACGRVEITLRGEDQDEGRGANPCDRLLKGGK